MDHNDELKKLEQEFEEFERQFNAFEVRLKQIRNSVEFLEIKNDRDKEKLDSEIKYMAMLASHGIEIKTD